MELLKKTKLLIKSLFYKDSLEFYDKKFLQYVAKKSKSFEHYSVEITTLALRGSNADYAFYSPMKEGLFNMGLTSSDAYFAYAFYNEKRKSLPALRNIIVFINPATIGFSLIKTKERNRAVAYNYFFNVPLQIEGLIDKSLVDKINKRCKKIETRRTRLSDRGYDKKITYGPIDTSSIEKRAKIHLRENKREPDQLIWLEKLAKDAKKYGHRCLVVITPCMESYKGRLPSSAELFEKTHSLESYGAEIFNYYDSKEFNDEHMGDADHLSELGAILLTKKILQDAGL
ncbi:hypothetical protein H5183_20790 [Pseudoalteromonas sp. SR44-8]|uniref:hypothetical protein n=1 Tax=Pseudoalteromonas sp. SR44-8 TaxID=2760933 RepID=UPI0015FF0776|nr:hypothetical protein [Pseudoalteromonas sp. SR44-8]MBB1303741.1 hypothetical protein [Pseudoalteromonas sp. SR44-8]